MPLVNYGSPTSIAITLTSLANSTTTVGRESTAIDNSSNKYPGAKVFVKTKVQAGTPGNEQAIIVFAHGSLNEGTPKFEDVLTGSDAAATLTAVGSLREIGRIPVPTAAQSYQKEFDVATAFDGVLPPKWGIFILNKTNLTLSATAGDHDVKYAGYY